MKVYITHQPFPPNQLVTDARRLKSELEGIKNPDDELVRFKKRVLIKTSLPMHPLVGVEI